MARLWPQIPLNAIEILTFWAPENLVTPEIPGLGYFVHQPWVSKNSPMELGFPCPCLPTYGEDCISQLEPVGLCLQFPEDLETLQSSLFRGRAHVAPDRKVFLKSLFTTSMTSCIANCFAISPIPPPSSFRFIHQWEVTKGGSATARVNKSRGCKMKEFTL